MSDGHTDAYRIQENLLKKRERERAKRQSEQAASAGSVIGDWEVFIDASYFDNWAVRLVGASKWGNCFHLPTRNEAMALAEILDAATQLIKRGGSVTRRNRLERSLSFHSPNTGTQRPGSPDGSLATETRKPGSLK